MSASLTRGPLEVEPIARWRRWRPFVWRAAVTLAALGLIAVFLPVDRLISAVRRAGAGRWLTVLLCLVLLQGLAVTKWRLLLRAVGVRAGWLAVVRAQGLGLFANNFLPSLVGGDVLRAGLLARATRRPEALAVSVLADRVLDALALLVLAAAGTAVAPATVDPGARRLLALAGGALVVGVGTAPALLRLLDRAVLPARLGEIVAEMRGAVRALLDRPRSALAALSVALVVQGGMLTLNVLLGEAMGLHVPLAVWLLVWPLAKLSALFPISLGGLGVRQLAMAALFLPFGGESGLVVAQSLTWESLLLALGLVGGALALGLRRAVEPSPAGAAGVAVQR